MSSSEEQEVLLSPNPFSTARRSKKYTSKKSYKDYLQSRPHGGSVDSNRNKSINANALSQSKDFPSSDKNNNTIGARGASIEHINGISKSSICGGGAAKFSLIMNDIHGIKQQKQQQVDDSHSLKINRMHGISLTTLNVTANEGKEKEILTISPHNNDNSGNVSSIDADSHDDAIKVTVTDDKNEFNDNNNNINNNNNGNHNHNHTIMSNGTATITRKYCDEGLEVKQKIVTRDDWYISDIDENDIIGTPKSPYGNISTGVSNSVLECVNQILLQQSMDEYIETQTDNKPKETTKESQNSTATSTNSVAPTRSNKRVHFSTKNSMVQIKPHPRHQHHHSLPSDINSDDDVLNSTYENQSTYSNEYELIGSSRTYVDMDAKSTIDNFKPTLPPKPSNLMKLQQIAKQRAFVQDQIYTKKSNSDYELNESEPDYASISEIQDTIKSVKVVTAEIHNDADNLVDNEYSEIKEVPTPTPECVNEDDSFADVPKLPNVYSIIPGNGETPTSPTTKKDSSSSPNNNNKCIGHDNYITKSPMKKKIPIANFVNVKKEKEKSKILTEMNKKQQQPPPVPMKHQQTIKIIDEEIQQEFDWYNLDAEYTKTDIVITPQIENIKEMYQFDDENVVNSDDAVVKVEYNLEDFEYETVPSSECSVNGIEIETNNNNFTTVIKINETSSISSSQSTSSSSSSSASSTSSTCEIHKTSPVNKKSTTTNLMELAETPKVDFKKNNKIRYEKFLKESGLISKPILMSKKKFYAEGSFV